MSGTGALFGSIVLACWGGPTRRVFGVLGCAIIQGLLLASCSIAKSPIWVLFVAFSYMFLIPLVRVCRESIWQRKVPLGMQGRVFALQRMIAEISLPMAAVIGGPLADIAEECFRQRGGYMANSFGNIVGVGPGRGVAFLFLVTGISFSFTAFAGLAYDPLRRIDIDLPDSIPTQPNISHKD